MISNCGSDLHKKSNEPNLRESVVMEEKGIELCLSEESDLDYEYLLKTIASTKTNYSMNSPDCNENISVESLPTIQKTYTDSSISSDGFEDRSANVIIEMQPAIQKKDTNCDSR